MSKLSVTTRTVAHNQKIQKIIDEVKKHPEGTTPKEIAFYTGIKASTVRGYIDKIPEIRKNDKIRGLYHSVIETGDDSIFSFNLHNAILAVNIPNYTKDTLSVTLSCELTNYVFEVAKTTKQATLRLSTDYPVNISSITLLFALFKTLVKQHTNTNIEMKDVSVRSIEFNKDFDNLKLEGVNCITLSSLIEQFKIYNKSSAVRLEHKIKVPLNANSLIKLLGVKI